MVARLLQAAGPRPSAPRERAARIRAAARAEWRSVSHRRAVRRRLAIGMSVVAAAAVVAVVARKGANDRVAEPGAVVAEVDQLQGAAASGSGANEWRPLAVRDAIRSGQWIRTDVAGRVALRLPDATSVRLDVNTRLRLVSLSVLELGAGAVYVDSRSNRGQLEIRTPLGTARDIGTQFELRIVGDALRLRVRTGLVRLADHARSVSGHGGTEVVWSPTGITTQPVPTSGPTWDWITALAQPRDIEGLALATFLDEMAREQGWTLRYADRTLERQSAGIVLHGSVRGLAPLDAVEVAVRTSGLRSRLDAGHLVVMRDAEQK